MVVSEVVDPADLEPDPKAVITAFKNFEFHDYATDLSILQLLEG